MSGVATLEGHRLHRAPNNLGPRLLVPPLGRGENMTWRSHVSRLVSLTPFREDKQASPSLRGPPARCPAGTFPSQHTDYGGYNVHLKLIPRLPPTIKHKPTLTSQRPIKPTQNKTCRPCKMGSSCNLFTLQILKSNPTLANFSLNSASYKRSYVIHLPQILQALSAD